MGTCCVSEQMTADGKIKNNPNANQNGSGKSRGKQSKNLLQPEQKIGKSDFVFLRVIGRGSFGKVYMVHKKDQPKEILAMKVLPKDLLYRSNLLVKTKSERDVMANMKSPFIVKLHYAFQTDTKLYFCMDFSNGGELFTHLRKAGRFTESRSRFYAAQLVSALGCLHANGIIYRDLKPENVLLDSNGYIKLTDFGLSKSNFKEGEELTYSFCGTPEYLAPEIISNSGHDKAVDWWSLGALLYEMLSSRPPHYKHKNRQQMLRDIVDKKIPMKDYFSPEAKQLLSSLLERNPQKRLGSGPDGVVEVMNHPFFKDIDWEKLHKCEIEAPYVPFTSNKSDCRHIDAAFTSEQVQETPLDANQFTESCAKDTQFADFTYNKQHDDNYI